MSKVNWFYEIGQEIKDDKRDLVIIDREIRPIKTKFKYNKSGYRIENKRYYKYKCNICGYDEGYIREDHLNNKVGCSCCDNKIAVLGINTILDTDHWMIDLGVNIEDAKKYTHSSGKKIPVTCRDCGEKKEIIIFDLYNRHSIGCSCGDGTSYPEKIIIALLKQLNINFKTQLNKKDFNWCGKYRYDFYLEDYNIIIETHGEQHYKERGRGRTLQEEQENDKIKKELAFNNDIDNYIEIDCRKSELDFIKNNILNSELAELFNLSKIDWLKCEEYALSNIVKKVCDYWHLHNDINNEKLTTGDLAKQFNIAQGTIIRYLNKGSKLGWCNYNPKEQSIISGIISSKKRRIPIKIFKNEQLLGVFESANKIEEISEKLFNIKLLSINIRRVCNGKLEQYKGFTFKDVTKEEYEEAVKNNTINKRIDNIELEQVS